MPKREDLVPLPISPYASVEAGGEQLLRALLVGVRHRDGRAPLLQRLWSTPGPELAVQRRRSPVHHRRSKAREPSSYGDGLQSRDFTYVANVVDATPQRRNGPLRGGATRNVGRWRREHGARPHRRRQRAHGSRVRPRFEPPRAANQALIRRHRRGATVPGLRTDGHVRPGHRARPAGAVAVEIAAGVAEPDIGR